MKQNEFENFEGDSHSPNDLPIKGEKIEKLQSDCRTTDEPEKSAPTMGKGFDLINNLNELTMVNKKNPEPNDHLSNTETNKLIKDKMIEYVYQYNVLYDDTHSRYDVDRFMIYIEEHVTNTVILFDGSTNAYASQPLNLNEIPTEQSYGE